MATKLDLSFVVPAKNEEGSIQALYQEIVTVVRSLKKSYEIIFIDDGSTDGTFEKMKALHKKDSNVKVIRFRGNFGKPCIFLKNFRYYYRSILLLIIF